MTRSATLCHAATTPLTLRLRHHSHLALRRQAAKQQKKSAGGEMSVLSPSLLANQVPPGGHEPVLPPLPPAPNNDPQDV